MKKNVEQSPNFAIVLISLNSGSTTPRSLATDLRLPTTRSISVDGNGWISRTDPLGRWGSS